MEDEEQRILRHRQIQDEIFALLKQKDAATTELRLIEEKLWAAFADAYAMGALSRLRTASLMGCSTEWVRKNTLPYRQAAAAQRDET